MATLRTNYQDDILDTSANLRRKYLVTENEDGSVSIEDVTTYTQNGDVISARDINAINGQINTNTGEIDTIKNTTIPVAVNRISTLENTTVPAVSNRVSTLETTMPKKVNKPTSGDGSSGQVLKTNGDGTTYWDNESAGGGGPLETSNTTTFTSSTITQTFTNGNTLTTTFNSNGTITEVFVDSEAGTTTTNVTTFNSDGSISVVSTTT